MEKPSALYIRAYELGTPVSMSVKTVLMSEDGLQGYLVLKNKDKKTLKLTDNQFDDIYVISTLYGGVARMRTDIREDVIAWLNFTSENEKDLAEYKRLKEKFGE